MGERPKHQFRGNQYITEQGDLKDGWKIDFHGRQELRDGSVILKKVPIKNVFPSRAMKELDKKYIHFLVNSIKRGEPIAAVRGYLINNKYYLHDGNHRLEAARRAGIKKVRILVSKGS